MAITLATSSALEDRTYGRRRSFGNAGDWCRRVDKWSVPRGTIHQGSLYCRRFGVFSDVENHVNNWTFNSKRALILGTATKQICFECSTWNALCGPCHSSTRLWNAWVSLVRLNDIWLFTNLVPHE